MPKIRLPKSIRKYIRKEKARIRREVLDVEKQKELIKKLYEKIYKRGSYGVPSKAAKIKNSSANTNRAIAQNVLSGKNL